MLSFFMNIDVVWQAFFAGLLTFFITALGSMLVFVFKKVNNLVLNIMMGVSAGVMISASIWSLLLPSIEQANSVLLVVLSFLGGIFILFLGDITFDKLLSKKGTINKEALQRNTLLMFSITLHNIPEGLAIGVAFGSVAFNNDILGALALAIGIGIQNFPEGCAVSLPLKRSGLSNFKSFLYGALSAIVEPISALFGAILVLKINNIMPIFLACAAGAMLYVAIKELIPESQSEGHNSLITVFTLVGFILMMLLDLL